MAEMIPSLLPDDTVSPGEEELFRRLRDDPSTESWIVFHSLEVAKHRKQISGEIDFLVIVPSLGVLALEVKAHKSIVRRNGLWYFGSEPEPSRRSPFMQAEEAMHSLRKTLVAKNTRLSSVPFFHAVIFTHCNFEEQSPEWHPWQSISRRRYRFRGVGDSITETFKSSRKHLSETATAKWFRNEDNRPDNEQVKILKQLLRPDFEVLTSPKERLEQQENEVRRFTQEQFGALDSLSACKRILFAGPAGTGKTVIALESARRAAAKGQKTLFLCYSSRLSKWLKQELSCINDHVSISTLHAKMLGLTGLSTAGIDNEFWRYQLPEAAWDVLTGPDSAANKYDLLIIDEAQDLIEDSWLLVLDELLKGGLSAGNWHFFGDFAGQSIFNSSESAEEQISRLRGFSSDVVHYQLKINCRNSRATAEHAMRVGNLGEIYSGFRRENEEGKQPAYTPFSSDKDQAVKVAGLINKMTSGGYPPSNIVVLSARRDELSVAQYILDNKLAEIAPLDRCNKKQIGYTTIHSFKGLEAPFIIITDIDDLLKTESRKLLYTAATRPTDSFHIFLSPDATAQLPRLLSGKSQYV
jgi:hypothetical protein